MEFRSTANLRRFRPIAGAAVLLFAAAGCGAQAIPRGTSVWADRFAFGTLGEHDFDVRDFCGERGAAKFEVLATPATALIGVATLGIYTPREVRIECR